jgi:hypothetical protein
MSLLYLEMNICYNLVFIIIIYLYINIVSINHYLWNIYIKYFVRVYMYFLYVVDNGIEVLNVTFLRIRNRHKTEEDPDNGWKNHSLQHFY